MAIFSQRLIDDILPKKNYLKLNLGIALVFILLLTKEGLSYLRQYFLLRQSKEFNNRIISFFYNHLLQLPKPFFDTRKIGELTARLNDTARIQKVIGQLAGNVVIDALMAIVATVLIFVYSWQTGIACILFMPLFSLLIYRYNKKIVVGQRNIMSSYAQTESNYISTLQGIEPIKNHNKYNLFQQSNQAIYNNYQSKIFTLGKIQISLSFAANAFAVLFLISVLTYASYQVLCGYLKTGELMAILGMSGSLLPSVANLALISIPINEAKIAFDRMFEFTGIEPEKNIDDSLLINSFESLQVNHLTFRFAGRSQILKDISFEVNKGEIIAIMGENGCGKSTLLQILQKHYEKETGEIFVNQKIVFTDINLNNWRNIIGVVPQNIHIFNGTVIENIAFDDAITNPQKVVDFIKDYGFADFIDNLPQSLMTIVGEEGINLSGGQKQMIAMARALYHQPQLLILDEGTSAMDKQSEQFILNLLHHLKQDMAVIFITHRLHVLKNFCDRIYILENGQIVSTGTHQTLLSSKNLYSEYWKDLIH
jgi:ABC-type bacteriocin/lantibiotic exporter with double-glycine peptidase domain